jgi:uridine kinase
MNPRIIGIAGASGSGKTTVAAKLQQHFTPEHCLIISTDNYYKDQTDIPEDRRPFTNYDHPDSIDFDLLAEHLAILMKGGEIPLPDYDFKVHNRSGETTKVKPKPYIIVEGILTLHAEAIAKLLELKIFVKTDLFKCYERRKHRDMEERGRTEEQVNKQFLTTVWPMYDKFIEPSKDQADVVLKNVAADTHFNMAPVIEAINRRFKPMSTATASSSVDLDEHKKNTHLLKSHSLFKHEKIKLVSLTALSKAPSSDSSASTPKTSSF